jgi:hypothetical protein
MADAARKGRMHPGEKNGRSKLTDAEARELRKLFSDRLLPVRDIAARFGVAEGTVYDISNGLRWRHLGPPVHRGRGRGGDLNAARMFPERLARGENHPRTKLTDAQVSLVRARCTAGEHQRIVATSLGISQAQVGRIVRGESRKL